MGTIKELYDAFSSLNLRDQLPVIIVDKGPEMTQLVKKQLIQGQLSTGEKINPTYASNYYAMLKEKLNPIPGYGVPDIKKTGALYEAMEVTIKSQTEYDIESTVSYADAKSITQYGDNLLRLNDDNKTVFAEENIYPEMVTYITEKTGLHFQ